MQKLLVIVILLIFQIHSKADNNLSKVLSVNNSLVTELDIINEIKILRYVNKNIDQQGVNIRKFAIENIINEIVKKKEIEKEQINLDNKIIENNFQRIVNSVDSNNTIQDNLKKIIYQKIELDLKWNLLISNKYRWSININIDEIDKKISDKLIESEEEKFKLKEKLINETKEKKLRIYSNIYLEKIKKDYLINYFQ